MGKNDFLTPKVIENQCRDENGFKCHCLSESHQHQMQVFDQNPTRIIGGYSDEFERTFIDFMDHLRTSYIADGHHVHITSNHWVTLTDFVKHLGSTCQCKVDGTPKGWFICYIDRDSETLFKDCFKQKRHKSEMVEEEHRSAC